MRPKDNDDRKKGAAVKSDVEEELGLFQTEETLEKDKMARAADGEKFGHPLDDTEDNGFDRSDGSLLGWSSKLTQ
jgi:hypothetical protein